MKLRSQENQSLTQPLISKHEVVHTSEKSRLDIYEHYEHPWYKFNSAQRLHKPNPPTQTAIDKAQFVDKTYVWKKDR